MVAPVRKRRFTLKQTYKTPSPYIKYNNSFWFPYLRFLRLPSSKLYRDQWGGRVYKNRDEWGNRVYKKRLTPFTSKKWKH